MPRLARQCESARLPVHDRVATGVAASDQVSLEAAIIQVEAAIRNPRSDRRLAA
jgi:hypothetical protein